MSEYQAYSAPDIPGEMSAAASDLLWVFQSQDLTVLFCAVIILQRPQGCEKTRSDAHKESGDSVEFAKAGEFERSAGHERDSRAFSAEIFLRSSQDCERREGRDGPEWSDDYVEFAWVAKLEEHARHRHGLVPIDVAVVPVDEGVAAEGGNLQLVPASPSALVLSEEHISSASEKKPFRSLKELQAFHRLQEEECERWTDAQYYLCSSPAEVRCAFDREVNEMAQHHNQISGYKRACVHTAGETNETQGVAAPAETDKPVRTVAGAGRIPVDIAAAECGITSFPEMDTCWKMLEFVFWKSSFHQFVWLVFVYLRVASEGVRGSQ